MHYNWVVALPMSMQIIENRLNHNYYRQAAACRSDAQLIASNAVDYNGEDSPFAHRAKGMSLCSLCYDMHASFLLT